MGRERGASRRTGCVIARTLAGVDCGIALERSPQSSGEVFTYMVVLRQFFTEEQGNPPGSPPEAATTALSTRESIDKAGGGVYRDMIRGNTVQ